MPSKETACKKTQVKIAAAAARDDTRDRLLKALHDYDLDARSVAVWALGQMDAARARQDILDQLLKLMRNSEAYVRWSAASAL